MPVTENPQGDAVVAPDADRCTRSYCDLMYINAVLCRFPGCDHQAQLAPADTDVGSLCFDHRQLLFCDEAEFDPLGRDRDINN
jgi:hypothetical protein